MSLADDVAAFWFSLHAARGGARPRAIWWQKDPAFDAAVHARFRAAHGAAAAGALASLGASARGTLALCLLLDQFPRNMFRGSARAFATDREARVIAERAIARGLDRRLAPVERWFVYMPFQHSEALAHQHRSVTLFATVAAGPGGAAALASARRHLEIIERFGRFPHRNAVLGRATTAAEAAFLAEPDSAF